MVILKFPTIEELNLQLSSFDNDLEKEEQENSKTWNDFCLDYNSVIIEIEGIIESVRLNNRQQMCLRYVIYKLESSVYAGY